jgi:hypothetical protein
MFSLLPLMGGAMNSENKQPLNCISAVHEFCRCAFKTSIFPCISRSESVCFAFKA